MLVYEKLSKKVKSFQKLTGVTTEPFNKIVEQVCPYWEKSEYARLSRPNRQRILTSTTGPDSPSSRHLKGVPAKARRLGSIGFELALFLALLRRLNLAYDLVS